MGAVCWVLPLEEEEEEWEEPRDEGRSCLSCRLMTPHSLLHTFPRSQAATPLPRKSRAKEAGLQPESPTHLSVCQRVRRVLEELVDTEKSYVKDLVCLFEVYLTPLQNETFLSKDEMAALLGILAEMLDFQRVFLQTLEEKITSSPDFCQLDSPEQVKKVLLSLGASFLHYAEHFKLYSSFCANHIQVQKVLERAQTDRTFKQFLDARNPSKQHSSSLDSFLIKPVQRVLKYPLLLRELIGLTRPDSAEHVRLTEALQAMEEVACHMNEVKKIHEEFGHVFQQLACDSQVPTGDFLLHSSAVWLNPPPGLAHLKKEPEVTLFVFKRAVIVVSRDKKKKKKKKKMPASRSLLPDPYKFRWIIPVSALQVRPVDVTGWETSCTWELVHCRCEEGGACEVFQLSSRALESKMKTLRVLQNLLTDPAPTHTPGSQLQWSSQGTSPGDKKASGGLLDSQVTRDLETQLRKLTFNGDTMGTGRCDQRRSRSEVLDLEKDLSVQSVTSMTNEDFFYQVLLQPPSAAVPTLQDEC
ncbi:rho guanine nucleotide exchange factor TIAM2-like isoform X2 [Dunckerocampus dactyliophorus]|uniref:rho guanine nucleotide exchange factor TIAM2-like isoform X2 n=1 Tax=Dunckerocampus dactyliophorus TaxID=161453 RepID=UPI0024061DCA|nr:rho guanine nucleotide exchange factor TIAM2-like isoform X2 [Dunckerocampus dactyliophorus]